MILSDEEILEAVKKGEIIIDPFSRENVGPCSVDLTLADEFVVFKEGGVIDPADPKTLGKNIHVVKTNGKPFVLKPKQFILAMTREKIGVSKNLAATLEGRSSIARLGIVVHAAGLVSPGSGMIHPKPLVLEVFSQNSSEVKLYPGMRIVQVIFHKLSKPATLGYDEHPKSTYREENVWIKPSALL
ncbi:MAG: dCTP deaminase [Thermoprotei archaeon]|nr:MAG: dCTP deaminase [Thermoprotei archaeon]